MGPIILFGHRFPSTFNYFNNKDAPRFAGGIWWAGRLALRMLLPVWVVIAFVAHGALVRVRADVCANIVHAHDAQRTVLGSANVIVHVISAANAAAGAGGFSRVVLSGAHAGMIPH